MLVYWVERSRGVKCEGLEMAQPSPKPTRHPRPNMRRHLRLAKLSRFRAPEAYIFGRFVLSLSLHF